MSFENALKWTLLVPICVDTERIGQRGPSEPSGIQCSPEDVMDERVFIHLGHGDPRRAESRTVGHRCKNLMMIFFN